MAGKKTIAENGKKASGNAKKAEKTARKSDAENQKKAADEDIEWSKGVKNNSKKEAEASKLSKRARRPKKMLFWQRKKRIVELLLKILKSQSRKREDSTYET